MNRRHILFQGRISLASSELNLDLELEEIEHLESLIPSQEGTLKQLSLVNFDLGDTAIRRKALGGRSLEDSAASLNDHLHFISSIVFRNGTQPRYLGLQRSTITDRGTPLFSLDDFREWAETISKRLEINEEQTNRGLQRYARPVRAPKTAIAKHLLLDLADFKDEFDSIDGDITFPEEFIATACEVADNGDFICEIAGKTILGTIKYSKGKFVIKSADLDSLFKPSHQEKKRPSTYLSGPSIMRVVTDIGLIYSDNRFYSPARLHGANRVHDLDVAISVPGFESIKHHEKGDKGKIGQGTWQTDSMFYHVDKNAELFKRCNLNPDILICDDLGTEIADFIAVDLHQKKIALLHVKMFTDSGSLSAKAMHEVVAQAKKNLGFLDPAEQLDMSRSGKWNGKWKWSKNSIYGLDRIRQTTHNFPDGQAIMKKIQDLLHSTSVQKEVWLVLGNSFTHGDLRKIVLADGNIPYHWTQLLYLIHSCHASVSAIGARFRIITGDLPPEN